MKNQCNVGDIIIEPRPDTKEGKGRIKIAITTPSRESKVHPQSQFFVVAAWSNVLGRI